MKQKRDRWKEKTVVSKKALRYQCRENHRLKQARNQYKSNLQEANNKIIDLYSKDILQKNQGYSVDIKEKH